MKIGLTQGIKGEYRVGKMDASGNISKSDWQNNLILDNGLNMLSGTSIESIFRWMLVGEDNTAPDVSQTGLISPTNALYGVQAARTTDYSGINNGLRLSREFLFHTPSGVSSVTYTEAGVAP